MDNMDYNDANRNLHNAADELKAAAQDAAGHFRAAGDEARAAAENVAEEVRETISGNPFDAFLNHQKKAIEELGKALESFLPPGVKEHGDEARREFAKGVKVLVDAASTEVERAARSVDEAIAKARTPATPTPSVTVETDRPSSTGKTKVKVQVD